MDHDAVVRKKMTEKYLLDELDPSTRDEFEEHFFDCAECAVDVQAGSTFVEGARSVLSEARTVVPVKYGWLAWLRPIYAAPALALLLVIVGYQNLVTYPALRQASSHARVLPWASVNVGTWGSGGPVITTRPGEGFLLFVRIPPESGYSHYTADLYDPAGRLEWSLTIPASSTQDQWPIQVPPANRVSGSYSLVVRGITPGGQSKETGRATFDLQVQK